MMVPLRMYDITTDEYRAPTQRDIDLFEMVAKAYGAIRTAYRDGKRADALEAIIESVHTEFRERAGMTACKGK